MHRESGSVMTIASVFAPYLHFPTKLFEMTDPHLAFGHVRLAINDLSTGGEQPFANPERTVFAVVNGEFYDHEAIKANLPEPYHFKGNSDCEIVIALYLQYGIYFLSKLRGEFAICLYDSRSQLFIAARDRYGIKPLYWSIQDGRLLVAAEMKAFLPFGWEPEWDVNSLMEDGWAQDDRMIFKNVRKVFTRQSEGKIYCST